MVFGESLLKKHTLRFFSFLLNFYLIFFLISGPSFLVYAQGPAFNLPLSGNFLGPSTSFVPVLLRGLKVYPEDALRFDFIVDSGDTHFSTELVKEESDRLIRYFLAALTIPKDDWWVNLSPYEEDRIVPESLGSTELGRDMLAQDYLLKQLTASLMYPEGELGKEFWQKINQKVTAQDFGINTLNPPASAGETSPNFDNLAGRIWIVPDYAAVYEQGNIVYVMEARLKVMLAEDYAALRNEPPTHRSPMNGEGKGRVSDDQVITHLIRELILPEIEHEVNTGENFAALRQIYSSLILAQWYKGKVKNGLMQALYVDKNKIAGIDLQETFKEKIYAQYMEAYKNGVYSYIKEDYDPMTQEIIPRKYFSGGVVWSGGDIRITADPAEARLYGPVGPSFIDRFSMAAERSGDMAMIESVENKMQFPLPSGELFHIKLGEMIFPLNVGQPEIEPEIEEEDGSDVVAQILQGRTLETWTQEEMARAASSLEELIRENDSSAKIIFDGIPILPQLMQVLIKFLTNISATGSQVDIRGRQYTLKIFQSPHLKYFSIPSYKKQFPSFTVINEETLTIEIYGRRLEDVVYELLKEIIFPQQAEALKAQGIDSEIFPFLAVTAQAFIRPQEAYFGAPAYLGGDIPVVLPQRLFEAIGFLTYDERLDFLRWLKLQNREIKRMFSLDSLTGQASTVGRYFLGVLSVLEAYVHLLNLQTQEKRLEGTIRKAAEGTMVENELRALHDIREQLRGARYDLLILEREKMQRRWPLKEGAVFDSSDPTSPIFVPDISAFGAALGTYRVDKEALGAGEWSADPQGVDISSRYFMGPGETTTDLAVRAVKAMILNYAVSLPREDFLTLAQKYLPFLEGERLRQAMEAKDRKRLEIIQEVENYKDIDVLNQLLGKAVLSDISKLVVYTSTPQERLQADFQDIQRALQAFGLQPGVRGDSGNAVCASFGPAMEAAVDYLRNERDAKGPVLVVVLAKYSSILNVGDSDPLFASTLFGDNAVALKLTRKDFNSGSLEPQGTVNGRHLRYIPGPRVVYGDLSRFIIVDHRGNFRMNRRTIVLFMDQVYKIIQEWADRTNFLLEDNGWSLVTHQPQLGGVKRLAKAFGAGTIIKIDKNNWVRDVIKTGYGRPGNDIVLYWAGREIANGGDAASPDAVRRVLSARYPLDREKFLEKAGQLVIAQDKPFRALVTGFGGTGTIYAGIMAEAPNGEDWIPSERQIKRAQNGEILETLQEDGSLDWAALLLNMATDPSGQVAPYLPVRVKRHYSLELLKDMGQRLPDEKDRDDRNYLDPRFPRLYKEARPLSFKEVLVIGAGLQGMPRIAEILKMADLKRPKAQKVYVFTRGGKPEQALAQYRKNIKNDDFFKLMDAIILPGEIKEIIGDQLTEEMLEHLSHHGYLDGDLRLMERAKSLSNPAALELEEKYEQFRGKLFRLFKEAETRVRLQWFVRDEDQGDHNLRNFLRQHRRIQMAFEVIQEKAEAKAKLYSIIWDEDPQIRIVTNSSSLPDVHLAQMALNLMTNPKAHDIRFRSRQIQRLLIAHDYNPTKQNRAFEVPHWEKRRIDPRFYKAILDFARLNGHRTVLVDDRFLNEKGQRLYALPQVGNIQLFAGPILAALRLLQDYPPEVIRKAAIDPRNMESPWVESPLPPLGYDPLETIGLVALSTTRHILEYVQQYLFDQEPTLDEEDYRFFLNLFKEAAQSSTPGRETKPQIWQSQVSDRGKFELLKSNGKVFLTEEAKRLVKRFQEEGRMKKTEEVTEEELANIRLILFLSLVSSGGLAVDRGIVEHPRWVDFFYAWTGGNLETGGITRWVDEMGPTRIYALMQKFFEQGFEFLRPPEVLRRIVEEKTTFERKFAEPKDIAVTVATPIERADDVVRRFQGTDAVKKEPEIDLMDFAFPQEADAAMAGSIKDSLEESLALPEGFWQEEDPLSAFNQPTAADVGGISMKEMSIHQEGQGIEIPFNSVYLQELMGTGFRGFRPIRIEMKPVENIFPIFDLDPAEKLFPH